MGKLNPLAKPKTPAPVVVQPPVSVVDDTQANQDLEMERKRRAAASGSTGNIKSSLVGAISDIQSTSKRSTLLGG